MTESVPSPPLVSIVMPTYKRAHLLQGAIESVLKQTFRNFELIVVDDNSPDDTPAIVARIQDPRVRYVRNEPNLRLPRALNRGFSLARGRFLTWTSDDNFYAPTAIERMVEALQNGGFGLVYADYYLFSEVDEAGQPRDLHHDRLPSMLQLEKGNHIGACFMYTREAYEAVGEYDPDLFLVEDYDYFIRIAKAFKATHLAEPLYFFRRDDDTLYLSRFAEVKASDVLVRYKNGLLDEEQLLNAVVELIAREPSAVKYPLLGRIHRVVRLQSWRLGQLLETVIRRRVRRELRSPVARTLSRYRSGALSFPEAREELRLTMQRIGTVEYRPAS